MTKPKVKTTMPEQMVDKGFALTLLVTPDQFYAWWLGDEPSITYAAGTAMAPAHFAYSKPEVAKLFGYVRELDTHRANYETGEHDGQRQIACVQRKRPKGIYEYVAQRISQAA